MTATATRPLTLALPDEAATVALMADLALLSGPGETIALSGDLGSGKTTAARAFIRYLADDPDLDVPSPTFTLVQGYDTAAFPVLHADLYRIGSARELDEIGLWPLPPDSLALIEWAERAAEALPADRIEIAFALPADADAGMREVVIRGFGKGEEKVERLRALRAFLTRAGAIDAIRQRMAGDASTRSYARLLRGGVSTVLMNSPARLDRQFIYGGKSYLAAVHLAEDIAPFVAVAGGLRALGLSAPQVHHVDLDAGFLISEDFGREGVIAGRPPAPIVARYEAAMDALGVLHAASPPHRLPLAGRDDYAIPPFDLPAMLIEVSLLLDWYLPDRGVAPTPAQRAEFAALWQDALAPVLAGPPTWTIRDYHSPNLIWLAGRSGAARVGIIDFQDTVLGPAAYDVASLAQDARLDIPEDTELALVSRYVALRRAAAAGFDAAAFARDYATMSAQRNTRLLGVFARLNRRDGKPHYLAHQPRIHDYLGRALAHPALSDLRRWFAANVPPPAA